MKKKIIYIISIIFQLLCVHSFAQTSAEWQKDIDILTAKIEQYHPMPWAKISKDEFMTNAGKIRSNLSNWKNEKIIVEIMKLVSSLMDGHTEVLLNSQESFNLWFPIRMEKFYDGVYITATDSLNSNLLGAKVLKIGKMDIEKAYNLVGEIVSKDNHHGIHRLVDNYLPNAVILKNLEIIDDENVLELEIFLSGQAKKEVSIESAKWGMWNNWTWYKTNVPTVNKRKSIFDDKLDILPLYLKKVIPDRIPYWFEYLSKDKMLYFQYNAVSDWNKDPFRDFTDRLFKTFDENINGIKKFVIDLRFNEGGNGYLITPFVNQFIQREKSFTNCKLYIITGTHTFSAAPNFIGQMLKNTNAITVGDIASGPLNWCSDIIDFILPNSNIRVNISSMYWQEGHATDNRGYYPPDYYLPATFKDYVSCSDPIMDAIKNDQVISLKDVLLIEGAEKFLSEINHRKSSYGNVENWFPYTSFDLIFLVYFNLIPEGKTEDALKILNFNSVMYPEDSRAWYALAETYREVGKIKEALKAYKKLISMEPNTFEVNNEYNKLLLLDTYSEKGIKVLSDLINELKKNNPHSVTESTLNNFGYRMQRDNKIQDAIKIFELNVEQYPESANAYNSVAEAYLKAGESELAIKNYEKSLQLNPDNNNAKKMLEELK